MVFHQNAVIFIVQNGRHFWFGQYMCMLSVNEIRCNRTCIIIVCIWQRRIFNLAASFFYWPALCEGYLHSFYFSRISVLVKRKKGEIFMTSVYSPVRADDSENWIKEIISKSFVMMAHLNYAGNYFWATKKVIWNGEGSICVLVLHVLKCPSYNNKTAHCFTCELKSCPRRLFLRGMKEMGMKEFFSFADNSIFSWCYRWTRATGSIFMFGAENQFFLDILYSSFRVKSEFEKKWINSF